jgi:type II secretory pathway component PulK
MDLPTGAAIVVTLIAAFVVSVIVSAMVPVTLRAEPVLAAAE